MELVKVQNKRPSIVWLPPFGSKFAAVRLMPGINLVPENYMEEAQKHKGVNYLFSENGCLDLVETTEGPLIPGDVRETLKGMSLDNAVSLIDSCRSEALLDKWATADDRAGIHKAIAKRVEFLKKQVSQENDSGEE